MKSFIKKLLSENSEISSVRFMSIAALFAAIAFGGYGLHEGKDLSALAILCGAFLGAAFGGKVSQKFAENKEDK